MDPSFIVTVHNFILTVCVGNFQSNNITIHNKGLTVVSAGKNTPPPPPTSPTTYNHSIELLKLISQTICRQVLGLVTLVSYYNYHQNIVHPDEPSFWVRIFGLPFTGDINQVHENFVLQEKY